jgi:hypothetical protein
MLVEEVMLAAPRGIGTFVIVCDASNIGVGNALLQQQGEELVLLEFGSKKFTATERNWDTREREAFAIKWSCEHYQDYLKGFKVVVFTDHESLKWMDNSSSGKVQRWALYIQQFNVEIRTIPGFENLTADWMSRAFSDELESDSVIDNIAIPLYLAANETSHTVIAPYVPETDAFIEGYKLMTDEELSVSSLSDSGLRFSLRSGQLFVPTILRPTIIYWFHATRYGAHAGVNRTIRRMRNWVWWPNMNKSVIDFIDYCLLCKRFAPSPRGHSMLGVLSSPFPLDVISLDFVGPRIWNENTHHYLIAIDHCSRFIVSKSCDAISSKFVIDFMRSHWLPVFSCPSVILCDRGSVFISDEFRRFVTIELSAYLVFTSPYYPQGNSINEASHQSIERGFKVSIADKYESFNDILNDITIVHNSIPSLVHGQSPFFVLFGFEPTFPGWQRLKSISDPEKRILSRSEVRHRILIRSSLIQDKAMIVESPKYVIDDWIVYYLSKYERSKVAANNDEALTKYSPSWSLPCRVIQVKDKVLIVREMGLPDHERQVPIAQVKLLKPIVPEPLAELNLKLLKLCAPVHYKSKRISDLNSSASSQHISDLVEQTFHSNKRSRPTVVTLD